jgi:hypothetical protein
MGPCQEVLGRLRLPVEEGVSTPVHFLHHEVQAIRGLPDKMVVVQDITEPD